MKGKIFWGVFLALFIAVGLGVGCYGFVRLGIYNAAERVTATVVSAEYRCEMEEAHVTFLFDYEGNTVQKTACMRDIKLTDGILPYYEGKEVELRVDGAGEVAQFGKAEILAIVTGCVFVVAGAGFLYFAILRKPSMLDYAYEYEKSIVSPDEVTDETAKYEARADELTRMGRYSAERMAGEASVWGNRIKDRFQTYRWQHVLIACYFILPGIMLGVYPLFSGKTTTVQRVLIYMLIWFFVACILGMIGKLICALYWKLLVKCGRFREKQLATVVCCAFESEAYFQVGNRSRTHMIFKKFRVVATVNGRRSIGYVKGNLPPAKGTVLKVLIRPNRYGRWIIDKSE